MYLFNRKFLFFLTFCFSVSLNSSVKFNTNDAFKMEAEFECHSLYPRKDFNTLNSNAYLKNIDLLVSEFQKEFSAKEIEEILKINNSINLKVLIYKLRDEICKSSNIALFNKRIKEIEKYCSKLTVFLKFIYSETLLNYCKNDEDICLDLNFVDILIKNGADPNYKDSYGKNALYYAFANYDFNYLLNKQCVQNRNKYVCELVKILLTNGANPNLLIDDLPVFYYALQSKDNFNGCLNTEKHNIINEFLKHPNINSNFINEFYLNRNSLLFYILIDPLDYENIFVKSLNQKDFEIIDLLIFDNDANPLHKDKLGKNFFDYLNEYEKYKKHAFDIRRKYELSKILNLQSNILNIINNY